MLGDCAPVNVAMADVDEIKVLGCGHGAWPFGLASRQRGNS